MNQSVSGGRMASNVSLLRQFIVISRLEGLSFILLMFIAMPLKYAADMPAMVRYVGWAHGVLFVAYVGWLLVVGVRHKWSLLRMAAGFVASLLPFGPFAFERWLQKHSER